MAEKIKEPPVESYGLADVLSDVSNPKPIPDTPAQSGYGLADAIRTTEYIRPVSQGDSPEELQQSSGGYGLADAIVDVPTQFGDRAGISQQPNEINPEEVITNKASYWLRRGVMGPTERSVFGLAQLPFEVAKYFTKDDARLNEITKMLDPTNPESNIGFWSKPEMATRAYREVAAFDRSYGAGIGNNILESTVDFGAFLLQLALVKKIPLKGGSDLGKWSKQTKAAATIAQKLKAGQQVTSSARNAAWAAQSLRHAALLGAHGALTTLGTGRERGKHAVMRAMYAATPVLSAYTGVANLPGAVGKIAPRVVDFIINTGITTATAYKEIYEANDKKIDANFWAQATPQIVMDALMSLSTAGFPEHNLDRHFGQLYKDHQKLGNPTVKGKTSEEWVAAQKKIHHTYTDKITMTKTTPSKTQRLQEGEGSSKNIKGETKRYPLEIATDTEIAEGSIKLENMKLSLGEKEGDEREILTPAKIKKFPREIQDRIYKLAANNDPEGILNFLKEQDNKIYWLRGAPDSKDAVVWYGPKKEAMSITEAVRHMENDKVDILDMEVHKSVVTKADLEQYNKFTVLDIEKALFREVGSQIKTSKFLESRIKDYVMEVLAEKALDVTKETILRDRTNLWKDIVEVRERADKVRRFQDLLYRETERQDEARLEGTLDKHPLAPKKTYSTFGSLEKKAKEFLLKRGYTLFRIEDESGVHEKKLSDMSMSDLRWVYEKLLSTGEQMKFYELANKESATEVVGGDWAKSIAPKPAKLSKPEADARKKAEEKRALAGKLDKLQKGEDYVSPGAMNEKGKEYGSFLSLLLKGSKFFGYNEDQFAAFVNKQGLDGIFKMRAPELQTSSEIKEKTVNAMMALKRVRAHNRKLGISVQDTLAHAVQEQVLKDFPKLPDEGSIRTPERLERFKVYSAIMTRAIEEVGHNDGEPITKYFYTDRGAGGAWTTPKQLDIVTKDYINLRTALNLDSLSKEELAALVAKKPEGLFFNLLPPHAKNTVLWAKADVEKQLLKSMLEAGVFDNSNLYENVKRGFGHRVWDKEEFQRGAGVKSDLTDEKFQAQKYDTYSEFLVEAGKTDTRGARLIVSEDFTLNVSDYVADSLDKVQNQRTLNILKEIGNPERPGKFLVEYAKNWGKNQEKAQGLLTEAGYTKMPAASGLARKTKGGFSVPWVHKSIEQIISQITEVRTAEGYAKVWLKLNGLIKRHVMFSPNLFALQIASTPMVWIGPVKALKHGIKPIAAFDIFRKGPQQAKARFRGDLDASGALSHLKGQEYNMEVLKLGLERGLRGFDVAFEMDRIFDKTQTNTKHPAAMSKLETMYELIGDKGGINSYTFNTYVGKMMYEYFGHMHKRFMKLGHSKEKAADLATKICNDTTGMLDSNIYGAEGKFLQGLLFARDFTMSFLRMGTGALGSKLGGKQDYATTGTRKYLNSLLHGEVSRADFDALVPIYRLHLAKVLMMKIFFINAIQYGLSFRNEDPEKRGKFAFQNEPGSRLNIEMPWNDPEGKSIYMAPLLFREADQMWDIFSSLPGLKETLGGRGIARWAKGKANYGLSTTIALAANANYAGRPITSNSQYVSIQNRVRDYAAFGLWAAQPTFARTDIKKPAGLFASQVLGMPLKRGSFYDEPGYPVSYQQEMRKYVEQANYKRLKTQKVLYASNMEEAWDMYFDREIGDSAMMDKMMREEFGMGASLYERKHRTDIQEGLFGLGG